MQKTPNMGMAAAMALVAAAGVNSPRVEQFYGRLERKQLKKAVKPEVAKRRKANKAASKQRHNK